MRISSYEVEEVKFPVTIRGYAEDEVDAFLDRVAAAVKEYEQRDAEARGEIGRLRSALDECREARIRESGAPGSSTALHEEVEARLRGLLDSAARTSERMVEEALEAGEHILHQIRTAMTAPAPADDPSPPSQD